MELIVKAYHLEIQINLNKIRLWFSKYQLLKREHTFLFYKIDEQSYIYIKNYGSVVFLNCETTLINTVIIYLNGEKTETNEMISEEYKISITDKIEVDFGNIQITELNEDIAHIIMLNLGQSVALVNYVNRVSHLHEKTITYSKQLEKTGKFKLSKLKMRKFIGRTMNLKNNIAENLFVFDSPDLAWNNKELSTLDYQLKDELDVVKRHKSIENSLNTIKENLDLFSDIIHHKYSSMLEWIIILLILFEIIQVIIEKIV